MTALPTWADVQGVPADGEVACPNCGAERPAFAIVQHSANFWGCDLCVTRMAMWAARDASTRPALTWNDIRGKRNKLLAQTDRTQLADRPDVNRDAWAAYRQELRDITRTFKSPDAVVWPEPPA